MSPHHKSLLTFILLCFCVLIVSQRTRFRLQNTSSPRSFIQPAVETTINQCFRTPEEVKGPYYIADAKLRSDIRERKGGIRLRLKLKIIDAVTCQPLTNHVVHLWHCDALGFYSGHLANHPDKPAPNGEHIPPSDDSRFLRGRQLTDSQGQVKFDTIFPGWYHGRTVHIHMQVDSPKGKVLHVGQFYFSEEVTKKVEKIPPYSQHKFRRFRNEEEWIFVQQRGNETILNAMPIVGNSYRSGLKAEMTIGVMT